MEQKESGETKAKLTNVFLFLELDALYKKSSMLLVNMMIQQKNGLLL